MITALLEDLIFLGEPPSDPGELAKWRMQFAAVLLEEVMSSEALIARQRAYLILGLTRRILDAHADHMTARLGAARLRGLEHLAQREPDDEVGERIKALVRLVDENDQPTPKAWAEAERLVGEIVAADAATEKRRRQDG